MEKKTLGIYQSCICEIGGVETFLYNFCLNMKDFFEITVVYGTANPLQLNRLRKIVNTISYNSKEQFEFDIVIRNSVWGEICNKMFSKENRYIEMRHANYKHLIEKGVLSYQYHNWSKVNEIIACGEFVAEMSDLVLHDHPKVIKNILAPRKKTNKIIKLISCTRLDSEKGWGRMKQMMQMMKDAGIKFEWDIFTNGPQRCDFEEVHFWKQRFDIWDYLANADYTVLLSDCEGLPYTVQESLEYQVPCIVTDIGGCTELIKDGVNGYVVPLDMNFDINKIKNIPKCKEYDNKALETWLEYLGSNVTKEEIEKEKKLLEEEYNNPKTYKVGVICKLPKGYDDVRFGKHIMPEDGIYYVDEDRANYLASEDVVDIVEYIEEK